jgi:hypothetical protein
MGDAKAEGREFEFRPVADLRAWLAGVWRIDRQLTDLRLRQTGGLTGTVRFEPDGDGLRHVETGILRLGAYEGEAEQIYLYRFPAPGRAAVFRRDGSFFHDLDLTAGRAEVEHLCGADTYRARFAVRGPDRWEVEWRVTGPRKDQVIRTRYDGSGRSRASP